MEPTIQSGRCLDQRLIRAADLALAAAALVFTLPLLILVSVAILIVFREPPLSLAPVRVANARHFRVLRFRSSARREDHPSLALLRAFLQRSRLVGLPSLWNVVVGDLSLVGAPWHCDVDPQEKPGLFPLSQRERRLTPTFATYLHSLALGVGSLLIM